MKYAADFRAAARASLRGKWAIAVIVCLVAALLGGIAGGGPQVTLHMDATGTVSAFEFAGQTFPIHSLGPRFAAVLAASAGYILLASLLMLAVSLFLGSVVGVGYAKFNLDLVDRRAVGFSPLFQYFPAWKNAVCTRLLKGLFVFLWSLLLVIPGIVASYSYSMTEFILAEHPEMTATEAIYASRDMMRGNRGRLFCLHLSFIGWEFLSALTLGIGSLWLNPYRNAATAAFYREVSGTERQPDPESAPESDPC